MNEKVYEFKIKGPFLLPFYNQWGKNSYTQSGAFLYDAFGLDALSTSGSPVIISDGKFIGFLNESGGYAEYDGHEALTVRCPEEQELFIYEGDAELAWRMYNAKLLGDYAVNNGVFYDEPEYCTWVEQKWLAERKNISGKDALTHGFVIDFMDRIEKTELPKGKLTIDAGWYREKQSGSIGDWLPDKEKFPDLSKTVNEIEKRGFIPGLWFSPSLVAESSDYFKADNTRGYGVWAKGENIDWNEKLRYSTEGEAFYKRYSEVFETYIKLGFKKFKLDIFYGPKNRMKLLLKACYEIIKSIEPGVEVECHIPDVFVSRYCDTVRTNDVLITDGSDWRGVTRTHYDICRLSSPDKVINVDHIGGNNPDVSEKDFLAHAGMLKNYKGYPVVSLLPDRFSSHTVAYIKEWLETKNWKIRENCCE
jgi:hypothetical protein